MKSKVVLNVVVGVMAAQTAMAIPVTLNFDDLYSTPGLRAGYKGGVGADQYVFTSSLNDPSRVNVQFGTLAPWNASFAGSTALYNNYGFTKTALTRYDGGAFNISSIDLSELFTYSLGAKVDFTGYLNGGSKVTQSFTLDGTFGFQTLLLQGFNNLLTLEWSQGAPAGAPSGNYMIQFDNLVVDSASSASLAALSVPDGGATLALMGLGLSAICLMGRQFKREHATVAVRS